MPDYESLYGEDNPTDSPPPQSSNRESPMDKEDEDETKVEGKTGLLPKSIFPTPPKPGDKCMFDVLRVHDEDVEVQYSEDKHEEGGESIPEGGNASPQSDMADYMS